MYILNCVRMGPEEGFRELDEARDLLRGGVDSIRGPERNGRPGSASLSRRGPIPAAGTFSVGYGVDSCVHPEEHRKWRSDPNH